MDKGSINIGSIISQYTLPVADFAGTDALIFRRNVTELTETEDRAMLRTQRGNVLMLDRPQFVGTLQTEEVIAEERITVAEK